jgi:hypothetical protein
MPSIAISGSLRITERYPGLAADHTSPKLMTPLQIGLAMTSSFAYCADRSCRRAASYAEPADASMRRQGSAF